MIIIVDDCEDSLDFFRCFLNKFFDCKILAFNSPQQAISFFKKSHNEILIVISDYDMPEMNGNIMLQKMKSINSNINMGIASGGIDRYGKPTNGYTSTSADFYISKPFDIAKLTSTIKKYMKSN